MCADFCFQFEGRDVYATPAYRILHAVDEEIVSVLILAKTVARMEPTVAPGGCGGFGISQVTMRHRPRPVGAYDQLTDIAWRHFAIVNINQAYFYPRSWLATGTDGLGIGAGEQWRGDLAHGKRGVHLAAEPL